MGAILNLKNETDTRNIAADMAVVAQKGDLITLSGELGAGKSLFARAFIRNYLDLLELDVPSPTYVMAIEYENDTGLHVTHMDLYRISNPLELEELGLENALENGVVLIEWPQQAGDQISQECLKLDFDIHDNSMRKVAIDGHDSMAGRYLRSLEIGSFLRLNWADDITRKPFAADASARNYELATSADETRILMDAPKASDGPVVKNGLPYSRIAHLAEEVRPFVAIANLLREKGYRAPRIYASDYDNGLVLLEHLGDGKITDSTNRPIAERYVESGSLLGDMHNREWPRSVKTDDGETCKIPDFDERAMMIEIQLLTDWYLKDFGEAGLDSDDIDEFNLIWKDYCQQAQGFEQSIVLRDYHSPNIIWREGETANERIGLIDFQDALIGPAAYDIASLAQDARVVVAPDLEVEIVARYKAIRKEKSSDFNEDRFDFEYAMMGAHRASKVLGFCVRVDKRDGKPQYRRLIPSVRGYLKRNLQHPKLSEYCQWCERVIGL